LEIKDIFLLRKLIDMGNVCMYGMVWYGERSGESRIGGMA